MQGIWVVTHTMHQRHAAVLPGPTSSQQVLIPSALLPVDASSAVNSSLMVGCGEVRTFVPKFGDGGVEPFGVTC